MSRGFEPLRYCLCLYLSENEKTLPQKTIELLLLYVVCMGLQYPKTHSGRPFLDENKLYVLNCMYSRRLMGTKLAKNLKMCGQIFHLLMVFATACLTALSKIQTMARASHCRYSCSRLDLTFL